MGIRVSPGQVAHPVIGAPTPSGTGSTPAMSDPVGVRRVFYQPARPPPPDGRTLLALSPLEFLEPLSRLIPPPRVHRNRYHGILAPNAGLGARVVNLGRGGPDTSEPEEAPPGFPGDGAAVPCCEP